MNAVNSFGRFSSAFGASSAGPCARCAGPRRRARGAGAALAAAARAGIIALGAALAGAACGGAPGGGEPVSPVLGGSPEAQADLQRILARFASGGRAERIALEPELLAFRRRHAGDDLARVADAHLAWIALEKGDLRRAEALSAQIEAGGRSATGDLARVLRGAALRRAGEPRRAFGALRPLVSKVIDPHVRSLLNEEITAAAMEAGAWTQAIELMSVWLREAGDDERAVVRARVEALLREVPDAHLTAALRAGHATAEITDPATDVRSLVAERLARAALERRDVALAEELLTRAAPLLGDQGDAVAALAAGAGTARVEPPTVGLLLSTRTATSRRRGVDIAAGVAHGLGLLRPGSDARLVSRDDGGQGSVDEALSSLTAEGAAVLIAGSDREQATAAARFARAHAIPVLLVHPPEPAALDGEFVFVVGEEPATDVEVLAAALAARGAKPIAVVGGDAGGDAGGGDAGGDAGGGDASGGAVAGGHAGGAVAGGHAGGAVAGGHAGGADAGDVALRLPCDGAFDARALRPLGVRGLVLAGDARCAEQVIRAAPRSVTIAVGFEAATSAPPGALVATAGPFPLTAAPDGGQAAPPGALDPAAPRRDAPDAGSTLAAWLARHPSPPSFWAALGHDAGVLARAGVRRLPKTGTEDPAEVKARRFAAASAVRSASTTLWTTSTTGFGGARVLPRTVGYREIGRAR
ncbi:hypothetical protein WMF31_38510 [Sorangium sp. So ce1036]|uniref:hypothetical protein n=1 Tax=Sorangium sp. So ce1036 TaxID=3133328 RepID=UPI003F12BCE0